MFVRSICSKLSKQWFHISIVYRPSSRETTVFLHFNYNHVPHSSLWLALVESKGCYPIHSTPGVDIKDFFLSFSIHHVLLLNYSFLLTLRIHLLNITTCLQNLFPKHLKTENDWSNRKITYKSVIQIHSKLGACFICLDQWELSPWLVKHSLGDRWTPAFIQRPTRRDSKWEFLFLLLLRVDL